MPVHDWSRVKAGIFHNFHLMWIAEINRMLNGGSLPPGYYALAEQHGADFVPDVLALKARTPEPRAWPEAADPAPVAGRDADDTGGLLLAEPKARVRARTDLDTYRRKQNVVAVRDSEDDELVAVVEIVSKGNKSGRKPLDDLLEKVGRFLEQRIHLLLVDLQPPTSRDPQGIHGAIWDYLTDDAYLAPPDKPLTLAAYESGPSICAYVEPIAVDDPVIDMPLFLRPGGHVLVPLAATYEAAWEAVPRRWREVIERP